MPRTWHGLYMMRMDEHVSVINMSWAEKTNKQNKQTNTQNKFKQKQLCWFQTSLPLAALPLRRVIIACCFRVAALSGHAALPLSPSGIAPELNRIQLSANCPVGQSGKVIDLLAWRCLPLGHPSVASGACAVVQKSPSKRQYGERQASLKAALGFF